MEERNNPSVIHNHYEAGSNCQVFNGPVSGCVFAMPGSSVVQQPAAPETSAERESSHAEARQLMESELWQRVCRAGFVDDEGQPLVSRTEAALLANELSERLGIAHKWKLFEALWHRNNMRGDYNKALEQRKSLDFQERLKAVLG